MVPKARLVMVPFQQLGFLSCSQPTALNLANFVRHPPANSCTHSQNDSRKVAGVRALGERSFWFVGPVLYLLSLPPPPASLSLPPSLNSYRSETKSDWQKQAFCFICSQLDCVQREKGTHCTIDSRSLSVLFCLHASPYSVFSRVWKFQRETCVGWVMCSVLLGQLWQPHPFPLSIYQHLCFLSLVWEAEGKDRGPHRDGFKADPSRLWCKATKTYFHSTSFHSFFSFHLSFPDLEIWGVVALDHLEITQGSILRVTSVLNFIAALMSQGPPSWPFWFSCTSAFLSLLLSPQN